MWWFDLLVFGNMSVSGSSLPGVEELEGLPLLADANPVEAVVDTFIDDDIDASCN